MNDQNEPAQLRFLEETAIRLRQNGFTVEPIEDHHLPVCWEKGRLCRITGKGSVLYRQENVDSIRAQDALQVVIDTAMTCCFVADIPQLPCRETADSKANQGKQNMECTVGRWRLHGPGNRFKKGC